MKLGFHVSIKGGINRAVDRAIELNCSTFQIFTRNPRSWYYHELTEKEIFSYKSKIASSNITPVYSHMPYIQNLSSPNIEIYKKSKLSLMEEVKRCNSLGIQYIVTHLGSHLGTGDSAGREKVVQALNEIILEKEPMLLLENGAGSMSNIGNHLEELAKIVNEVEPEIGVCFDTCHAFTAGYNVSTKTGLLSTIKTIESTIGLNSIKLVHLNDSKGAFNSHLDHHEHIGLGKIGLKGFKEILKSKLSEIPLIMETPIDDRRSEVDNMKIIQKLYELNH